MRAQFITAEEVQQDVFFHVANLHVLFELDSSEWL